MPRHLSSPRLAWALVLAVSSGLGVHTAIGAVAGTAAEPGHVPEPAGLYDGAMHGYTPNEVSGATVIDTGALAKLMAAEHPVLIDVAEKDRKPPSMSKDTPWFPIHRTIPGAVFLQGAGSGTSDPAFQEAFAGTVASLTGGDKAKPIVTFCHPDCWGSYNAAKRLVALGYTRVFWFRDGLEGWQGEHDTRSVKPDAAWLVALDRRRVDAGHGEAGAGRSATR